MEAERARAEAEQAMAEAAERQEREKVQFFEKSDQRSRLTSVHI